MKFSTRNAFYLRASNYRVVPLFLYLDERHVDWMTDKVLQLVIGELQSKMRELLYMARFEKKHKVFAERGEGYQYCYFLRSTSRTEVVLLKEKSYSLRAPTPPPAIEPSTTPTKRKRPSAAPSSRSRSRTRSVSVADRDESPSLVEVDEPDIKPEPSSPGGPGPSDDNEEEDEEMRIKDFKPSVDVTFKGFGTSSLQLVLIIEPYPALPPEEYAPPSSRLSTRSASIPATYSRSRSKLYSGSRAGMEPDAARTSTSQSQSVALGLEEEQLRSQSRSSRAQAPNMRNASRSVSTTPAPGQSRRGGGSSVTPFGRYQSSTPFALGSGSGSDTRARPGTPLFLRGETPFGDDEEDEEAHEAYTEALREGRLRLPSISRPDGTPAPGEEDSDRRSVRRRTSYSARGGLGEDEEDENVEDIPDGMMRIGERLVRSSQIEEGVNRVQGGWEERADGEESAVMGREDPDE